MMVPFDVAGPGRKQLAIDSHRSTPLTGHLLQPARAPIHG